MLTGHHDKHNLVEAVRGSPTRWMISESKMSQRVLASVAIFSNSRSGHAGIVLPDIRPTASPSLMSRTQPIKARHRADRRIAFTHARAVSAPTSKSLSARTTLPTSSLGHRRKIATSSPGGWDARRDFWLTAAKGRRAPAPRQTRRPCPRGLSADRRRCQWNRSGKVSGNGKAFLAPGEEKQLNRHALIFSPSVYAGSVTNVARSTNPELFEVRDLSALRPNLIDTGLPAHQSVEYRLWRFLRLGLIGWGFRQKLTAAMPSHHWTVRASGGGSGGRGTTIWSPSRKKGEGARTTSECEVPPRRRRHRCAGDPCRSGCRGSQLKQEAGAGRDVVAHPNAVEWQCDPAWRALYRRRRQAV